MTVLTFTSEVSPYTRRGLTSTALTAHVVADVLSWLDSSARFWGEGLSSRVPLLPPSFYRLVCSDLFALLMMLFSTSSHCLVFF